MNKKSIKRVAGATLGTAAVASGVFGMGSMPLAHAAVSPNVNLNPKVLVHPYQQYNQGGLKYEQLQVTLTGDVYNRGVSVSVVQKTDGSGRLVTSSVWPISLRDPSDASLCVLSSSAGVNYADCQGTGAPGGTVQIFGSDKPDDITINAPGHFTDVEAAGGNDTVHAFNSAKDHVNCQAGNDTAFVDHIDIVGAGCETVKFSAK